MSTAAPAASAPRNTQPQRASFILGICCLSLLLTGMDVTIVNVALPAIQHDLHATLAQLQWIVDAYTLVVASLLMLSGSIADRFGRRRVFGIGLVLFIVGSLLCSLVPNIESLIAFRAIQGLGASMLNPVALSIIANSFQERVGRARAIGVWGAVGGISFALGPVLGGALTQALSWRSIFWINLPVGMVALVLAVVFVPESKAPRARAFDPGGQLLVFLTLASLTYAVIQGPDAGWRSARIVSLFVVFGVSLLALLVYEPRRAQPLLDLRFFRSVPFSSATALAVCSFASFAGFLFLNALYLQQVRGLSALHTGLCTLPLAATMTLSAPLSGRLVGSRGTRLSLLIAGVAFVLSTVLLTHLGVGTPLSLLLLIYALFGVGIGMVNPAIANSAVAGMPLSQAGVASAVASTSRQVGAAFGVAIAGTVVSASRAHGTDFTCATHPIWWGMVGCGGVILLIAWLSNTAWARATAAGVAYLLDESRDAVSAAAARM